jgi:hypothetical protein
VGLASSGLEIGVFCDFLYSALLFQTVGSTCEFWVNPVNFTFQLEFAFPGTSAGRAEPWHCELVAALVRATTAGPGRGGGEGLRVLTTV